MQTIQVHLVCGFFGAGKTSYINRLLPTLRGTVCVVQNELGEVALAADGVTSGAVLGGCVCCSLAGELLGVLSRYALEDRADHIIAELPSTALLSDVVRYCRLLGERRGLSLSIRSTDIIDCTHFASHLRNFGKFYSDQIRNADRVILTRSAGAGGGKMEPLLAKLRELAPGAELIYI